jgi:hypothetical protein
MKMQTGRFNDQKPSLCLFKRCFPALVMQLGMVFCGICLISLLLLFLSIYHASTPSCYRYRTYNIYQVLRGKYPGHNGLQGLAAERDASLY